MATMELMTGRSAREVLAWSRANVDPALRAAVDTLPASMRRIACYHFGWWDEHGSPATADAGKAIRPALVLLSAEAAGRTSPAVDAALPAAVAVELVHNFSLLHDDVMDGDMTRRHRPTAWSVYGRGAAILAGDALLTLAMDVLAGSGHQSARAGVRMLGAAVLELLDGQSADLDFEDRTDVDVPECMSMAEGKTGALLACACGLGALFGGASKAQVEHLRGFGRHLGVAFQHVDDLLGIWGDPVVTGKPVFADLQRRKKSMPVVAALTSGTAAGRELAGLYEREAPLSGADLVHAAELIDRAGARAWSQAQADGLLALALRHLRSAAAAQTETAELATLAKLIIRRDR